MRAPAMRAAWSHGPKPRIITILRKRRAFGLDAPRPPDLKRLEADIRDWLEQKVPSGLVLRLAAEDTAEASRTLLILLPGCRVALLCMEAGAPDRSASPQLAADCRARGIALALVSSIDDVRAALRGLGIEPEER